MLSAQTGAVQTAEEIRSGNITKETIKRTITEIYAHADGTYSINIGVHITGCGGLQPLICTTIHAPPR